MLDHPHQDNNEHNQNQEKLPLMAHLIELRARLLISLGFFVLLFGGCYYFSQSLFSFFVEPLYALVSVSSASTHRLIYTNLTEAFFVYVKVAFWCALYLACPLFLHQLWRFLAPALYQKERRVFLSFMIASPILFFLGGIFVYYFIFPMAWSFFLSFEVKDVAQMMPVMLEAKMSEYLDLVLTLIFAFGLAFQLPVLLLLLIKVGVLNVEALKRFRRYAVVLIFIAAAILTPPDVLSQVALAIPLLLLYEFSIFFARFL